MDIFKLGFDLSLFPSRVESCNKRHKFEVFVIFFSMYSIDIYGIFSKFHSKLLVQFSFKINKMNLIMKIIRYFNFLY